MKIDGGCHCGAIAYEAEVDPATARICHCTDCQSLSGSAFRTVVFAPAAGFRITRGRPKVYVKTAESGARRAQAFCGECGSPIYSAAPENPPVYSIRTGTARQCGELAPAMQTWCRSAQGWLAGLESVPRHATVPPKG